MNKHIYKKGMDIIIKDNLDDTDSLCGYVDCMEEMLGKKYNIISVSERAIHVKHPTHGSLWFSAKDVARVLTEEEKIKMKNAKKPIMFDPKNL